jgi:hypothetical protein
VLDEFAAWSAPQDAFVVHDRTRQRYLFFPNDAATSEIQVYQYGTSGEMQVSGEGVGVDPLDNRMGAWATLSLPTGVFPRCAAMVERSTDAPYAEVWVGGSDGRIYWLNDPSASTWSDNGNTYPVESVYEAVLPLAPTPKGRGEPRYLELETYASEDTFVAVRITILAAAHGGVLATRDFEITVPAGEDGVFAPIPRIGRHGCWMKIRITHNKSGVNYGMRAGRVYYIPRGVLAGRDGA